MAKQLQNITLGSVGFYGLNTEMSPVELPPEYASTADNAVIDSYGRLGARMGFTAQSNVITGLNSNPVKRIFEWNSSGTSVLFAVGNNKIFRVDTVTDPNDTLTEMDLPVAYSITGDDWHFADFNGEGYFFQAGHEPLLINTTLNATDDLDTLDSQSTDATPAAPEGSFVGANIGRLWAGGDPAAPQVLYWSDTLIGDSWDQAKGGTAAGQIDLNGVWPTGYDVPVNITFHNGRLIIFGKENILIYAGADDPTASTFALEDTISGVGCIERDSIQHTGEDVIYLSSTGIRTLSRTLEQSSLPIGEVTTNVRTQLLSDYSGEGTGVNSVFSPEKNFYLLVLEGQNKIYCVDFKTRLEGGVRKITTWSGSKFNCFCRTDAGTLYCGGLPGVGTYSGYNDDGSVYRYQYYSPSLTFGAPGNLKVLKKIRPIVVGASGEQATLSWGYGYDRVYRTHVYTLGGSGGLAEYGVGEYGISEFSSSVSISDDLVNATGNGTEVTLGLGLDIDGQAFSLQQMSVQAIIGKIL
jgi:hypothetical protein